MAVYTAATAIQPPCTHTPALIPRIVAPPPPAPSVLASTVVVSVPQRRPDFTSCQRCSLTATPCSDGAQSPWSSRQSRHFWPVKTMWTAGSCFCGKGCNGRRKEDRCRFRRFWPRCCRRVHVWCGDVRACSCWSRRACWRNHSLGRRHRHYSSVRGDLRFNRRRPGFPHRQAALRRVGPRTYGNDF
jgi:hypothetical protein